MIVAIVAPTRGSRVDADDHGQRRAVNPTPNSVSVMYAMEPVITLIVMFLVT